MTCLTCHHAPALHDDEGCHSPDCSCMELVLPPAEPEIPPAKPGACVHLPDGPLHVVETEETILEKLESTDEFIKLTAIRFSDRKQIMGSEHIRPQLIGRFHELPQAVWDNWMKEHGLG